MQCVLDLRITRAVSRTKLKGLKTETSAVTSARQNKSNIYKVPRWKRRESRCRRRERKMRAKREKEREGRGEKKTSTHIAGKKQNDRRLDRPRPRRRGRISIIQMCFSKTTVFLRSSSGTMMRRLSLFSLPFLSSASGEMPMRRLAWYIRGMMRRNKWGNCPNAFETVRWLSL